MKRVGWVSAAVIFVAFLGSCATMSSDMQPDWSSPVRVEPLGSVYVMDDGGRVLLGTEKDVYLLDGRDGSVVLALQESFWDQLSRNVSVTAEVGSRIFAASTGDVISWQYDFAPLTQSDVILMFDFRFATESVTAFDRRTGEELWQNTDYEYSLGKYSRGIERIASNIGRRMGDFLGADSEEESEEERRERQVLFMRRVIHETPDSELIFFKTFDGLVLLDPRTGREIGSFEFKGAGLADVQVMDNGDYIVVSGGRRLTEFALATEYNLARITPSGELVWRAEHSGKETNDLIVAGDVIIVNGGPTEAFDAATGTPLWTNEEVRFRTDFHFVTVDGDYVYFASDLLGGPARVPESKVWKQHLRSGDIVWEGELTRGAFFGMNLLDGVLLVWGEGRFFENDRDGLMALDAETGRLLWQTDAMEVGGLLARGNRNMTDPVLADGYIFIADRENLFVIDPASGSLARTIPHNADQLGRVMGLELRGDAIVLVGTDKVAAYNRESGATIYITEIENALYYRTHGDWISLTGSFVSILGPGRQIQVLNLENGYLSPLVRQRTGTGGNRVFGDLDGSIFVDERAGSAISIDRRGTVWRHSF